MGFEILPDPIKQQIFKDTCQADASIVVTLGSVCKNWYQLTQVQRNTYYFQQLMGKIETFRNQLKEQLEKKHGNLIEKIQRNNQQWEEKVKSVFLPLLIALAKATSPDAEFALFKAHCFSLYKLLKANRVSSSDDFFEFFLPQKVKNPAKGYIYLTQAAQHEEPPIQDKTIFLKQLNGLLIAETNFSSTKEPIPLFYQALVNTIKDEKADNDLKNYAYNLLIQLTQHNRSALPLLENLPKLASLPLALTC